MSLAEATEPIEMQFEMWTRGGYATILLLGRGPTFSTGRRSSSGMCAVDMFTVIRKDST